MKKNKYGNFYKIEEKVVWAEGRKKTDIPNYTWWSSSKDCAKLGGFTITNLGGYVGSNVGKSVKVTAHTSHGESYWKNFDIPLDKVEEFCDALMKVKNTALKKECLPAE